MVPGGRCNPRVGDEVDGAGGDAHDRIRMGVESAAAGGCRGRLLPRRSPTIERLKLSSFSISESRVERSVGQRVSVSRMNVVDELNPGGVDSAGRDPAGSARKARNGRR